MKQDSKENYEMWSDESRRSFMKKGALASGALALGLGASETVAAQQAGSALVFAYDYSPLRRFVEVARLQQTTANQILRELVDQPDEWRGFVARYQSDDDDPGEFFLAFTRGGVLGTGSFAADATFFSSENNLLTSGIREQ